MSYAGINLTDEYFVVPPRMVIPDGIAIDWINDKIYWNDVESKRLEVSGRIAYSHQQIETFLILVMKRERSGSRIVTGHIVTV